MPEPETGELLFEVALSDESCLAQSFEVFLFLAQVFGKTFADFRLISRIEGRDGMDTRSTHPRPLVLDLLGEGVYEAH